jgi:hypothetical protein
MKHLILDFETLSNDSFECAAFECSAFVFDLDKMLSDDPYGMKDVVDVKYFKLNSIEQIRDWDYKTSESTLDWWEKQSEEARASMKPKKSDLTLEEFTNQFIEYVKLKGPVKYWWSRGNTFDGNIITRMFKSLDKLNVLDKHLHWGKIRDTRTFIDALGEFKLDNSFIPVVDEEFWKKAFVQHDSRWDVIADTLRIQALIRASNNLEIPDR